MNCHSTSVDVKTLAELQKTKLGQLLLQKISADASKLVYNTFPSGEYKVKVIESCKVRHVIFCPSIPQKNILLGLVFKLHTDCVPKQSLSD